MQHTCLIIWCNCAYQPVGLVRAQGDSCGSEASVTYIPAGSPKTTDMLAIQLQLIQT